MGGVIETLINNLWGVGFWIEGIQIVRVQSTLNFQFGTSLGGTIPDCWS